MAKALMRSFNKILSSFDKAINTSLLAARNRIMPLFMSSNSTVGIALPRIKPGLPGANTLKQLSAPAQLTFPLLDYYCKELKPLVRVGDHVSTGEQLAAGIIASCHGTVSAITRQTIIHPSLYSVNCICIKTDADNTEKPVFNAQDKLSIERIQACGIVGLGGAGFSSASKLSALDDSADTERTLVINAVECEPMISCDESLMQVAADEIALAIAAMVEFTQCHHCIFAIENDKKQAIALMADAIAKTSIDNKNQQFTSIEMIRIPPSYPSGAEPVLLQQLTKFRIRNNNLPTDENIICLNVATVHAIWRARQGFPLTSRIITIAGSLAPHPCNVLVRIGTSVRQILTDTDNLKIAGEHRVRAGGPLSGFDLLDLDVPVTATTNCIAIEPCISSPKSEPCIRCGECSKVCPVNLLPQQLYWYCRENHTEQANRFGLDQCIECGCCDIVCPSHIPLTQSFRHTKSAYKKINFTTLAAAQARDRHERHVERQVRHAARIFEQRQNAIDPPSTTNNNIDDTLARAQKRRRKRKQSTVQRAKDTTSDASRTYPRISDQASDRSDLQGGISSEGISSEGKSK